MKKKFTVATMLIDFFTAYILMSILFFLRNDSLFFYFSLDSLVLTDFYLLIGGTLLLFAGIVLSRIWIRSLNRGLILSLVGIFFFTLFSFYAPTKSLAIGSLFFSIPFLVALVLCFEQSKSENDRKIVKVLHLVLFITGILLFALSILFLFIKGIPDLSSLPYPNDSLISNEPLYSDFRKNLWKISTIIFFGLSFLYGLVKVLKLDQKIGIMKPILEYTVVFAVLVVSVVWLSLIMVYRTKVVVTPTYDFGIFTQMFYSMKNGRGMVTTLERGIALSHLSVHFSPIYYLMLPAFLLFPFPETLQVLQVLTLASGVIPLIFIMKHLKTPRFFRTLIILMYLVHPALIMSGYYDLHENCFLAPLILTLLYFCLKRQWIGMIVFTILTLFVKEDAVLYTVVIGFYVLFTKKDGLESKKDFSILQGSLMITLSIFYFFSVRSFLENTGEGAMFWRYDNLLVYPETGLAGIVIGIIQNPTYFFATLFSPEKMTSFVWTIASLGFLPLLVRKPANFLLVVPYIIMNMASNYRYQSEFGFQYFYGSVSLLTFMAVLAESEHRNAPKNGFRKALMIVLDLCAIFGFCTGAVISTESTVARRYDMENYLANPTMYESIRSTLVSIPEDKVVVATGLLTTYLADRPILYDFDYYTQHWEITNVDYIIIDRRLEENALNRFIGISERRGFVISDLSTEYLIIYELDLNE